MNSIKGLAQQSAGMHGEIENIYQVYVSISAGVP